MYPPFSTPLSNNSDDFYFHHSQATIWEEGDFVFIIIDSSEGTMHHGS